MPPVLVFVFVLAVGALVVVVRACVRPLERRMDRLSRMEGKLDAIMKHSAIAFDPLEGMPADALEALRQGQKIEAIKRYRHATGADLKDAKDAIEEALRRQAGDRRT